MLTIIAIKIESEYWSAMPIIITLELSCQLNPIYALAVYDIHGPRHFLKKRANDFADSKQYNR